MSGTSRDAALRILDRLFASGSTGSGAIEAAKAARGRTGTAPAVSLVEFQAEGAARVRAVLEGRGGAVLADSVGLGKTYVALALIEETLVGGGDAVIIAPAAIRGLWRRALRRLDRTGGAWRLLSHTQLARGAAVRAPPEPGPAAVRPAGRRLLVVDEAHRFRNPRTLRYAALARLVAPGTRVLLMTATPVNNRPEDLLHLVRLFASDDAFRDVGVPSLRDAFRHADLREAAGAEEEVSRVAAVVRAVVVRRTRSMVRDRFGDSIGAPAGGPSGPRFPPRAPPRVVRYDDPVLPRLVAGLAGLELAPYAPPGDGSAAGASSGAGAGSLVRLNLLKRLDSSPAALEASLERLGRLLHASLDAARAGRIVTPGQGRSGGRHGDGDPLQLALVELVARPAPPDIDLAALARSAERDLHRVRELSPRRGAADPKLLALRDLVEHTRGDKTLVFTEYRDTAEALWRGLSQCFRVGRVDGSGAWLGRRRAGRRTVVERFAPRANGRRPPPDRERVDVLIATDVLAEGLNLQDARHVVSYDLPWNPVRLLQRIGRVDRLGSPHDEVMPWLFVPDRGLETILGLTRRLRTKLGHIATTVGAERADELLERLARRAGRGSEDSGSRRLGATAFSADDLADVELDRVLAGVETGREDPMEALRTLWVRNRVPLRLRSDPPRGPDTPLGPDVDSDGVPSLAPAPLSVDHGDPAAGIRWLVLVGSPGGVPALLEIDLDGRVKEAGMRAVAAVSRALAADAVAPEVESGAAGMAEGALPLRAIEEHVAGRHASADAPVRLSPRDPGLRLARRIRRTMARAGAGLDPRIVARADALLARIATPLDPASEARVRTLADTIEDPPIEPLLEAAERAVGESLARADRKAGSRGGITVLGALRIHLSDPPPGG